MTLIQRVAQRWRDWRLEREILLASANMSVALHTWGVKSFMFENAAIAYDKLASQRSPQQLARMAKGQG